MCELRIILHRQLYAVGTVAAAQCLHRRTQHTKQAACSLHLQQQLVATYVRPELLRMCRLEPSCSNTGTNLHICVQHPKLSTLHALVGCTHISTHTHTTTAGGGDYVQTHGLGQAAATSKTVLLAAHQVRASRIQPDPMHTLSSRWCCHYKEHHVANNASCYMQRAGLNMHVL